MSKPRRPPRSTAFDEDAVITRIESGESISQVALGYGVNRSVLWRWLQATEQRSARASAARQYSAGAYDEKAEDAIVTARDAFELSRAKELAHHYRWRASKIAPKEYGDKLDLNHAGSLKVSLDSTDGGLL